MPGEETIAGLRADRSPSARANSRWVQPPGLPSSGSIRMLDGALRSASASSRRARSSTWISDRRPLRRHQHQAELGHPEQLERLLVAGAVDRRRTDDRPVEAGACDQLLRPRLGRAVERQLRLARGERGDVDEAAGRRPRSLRRASPACRRHCRARSRRRRGALMTPATWMTASAPSTSRCSASRSSRRPATHSTPSRVGCSRRVSALTSWPAASAASIRCEPTKPVPPVIAELHSGRPASAPSGCVFALLLARFAEASR